MIIRVSFIQFIKFINVNEKKGKEVEVQTISISI